MWAADGITFYGIFHTHPGAPGYERLSGADTAYIQRIMRSTAAELLYFRRSYKKVILAQQNW